MIRTTLVLGAATLAVALTAGAGGRPAAQEESVELAPGPGGELVALHCAVCHSLKIVVDTRMSRQDWDDSITWMQKKHHLWEFGEENRALILDYLEATQGPAEEGAEPDDPGPWAQPLYPLNPLGSP